MSHVAEHADLLIFWVSCWRIMWCAGRGRNGRSNKSSCSQVLVLFTDATAAQLRKMGAQRDWSCYRHRRHTHPHRSQTSLAWTFACCDCFDRLAPVPSSTAERRAPPRSTRRVEALRRTWASRTISACRTGCGGLACLWNDRGDGLRAQISTLPCHVVHGKVGDSGSCEVATLRRWRTAWLQSMGIYLPVRRGMRRIGLRTDACAQVHAVPRLLFGRQKLVSAPIETLTSTLLAAARSSAFLATFVASIWASVCAWSLSALSWSVLHHFSHRPCPHPAGSPSVSLAATASLGRRSRAPAGLHGLRSECAHREQASTRRDGPLRGPSSAVRLPRWPHLASILSHRQLRHPRRGLARRTLRRQPRPLRRPLVRACHPLALHGRRDHCRASDAVSAALRKAVLSNTRRRSTSPNWCAASSAACSPSWSAEPGEPRARARKRG
jgi:hypothetical protein